MLAAVEVSAAANVVVAVATAADIGAVDPRAAAFLPCCCDAEEEPYPDPG